MRSAQLLLQFLCALPFVLVPAVPARADSPPPPVGKLVDLGGHRLHVFCTGHGSPTVLVEAGLGDFSFDWTLVQTRVAHFTRICTYDRAGYAWSDPGPKPRTFAQINLELHDALEKLGEQGPFILVGHSYGGPVVRNFASLYPRDVAGMVLVDSAFEGMRVGIGGKKTAQLGVGVEARAIPQPREDLAEGDKTQTANNDPQPSRELDALSKKLPPAAQRLHLWAQNLAVMQDAESSQREWSEQCLAAWLANPGSTSLGSLPLIVLSRAEGGFGDDADVPAAQMEQERKAGQAKLAQLSTNSRQIVVRAGHNMHLEAPAAVNSAISFVVQAVRGLQPLHSE